MRLGLYAILVIGLSESTCSDTSVCRDYAAQVILTDVGYDAERESLALSYYEHVSACSVEKKYSISLAIIDLKTMTIDVNQRYSTTLKLYRMPESYSAFFENNEFDSSLCVRCEFRIQSLDYKYEFVFVTQEKDTFGYQMPMTLHVFQGATEKLVWTFGWEGDGLGPVETDPSEKTDGVDGGID
jgi:hypothetical protein